MILAAVLWSLWNPPSDAAEGLYLAADNGADFVLIDSYGPVELSAEDDRDLFSGLTNGDRIRVWMGPAQETYPARAQAFRVKKLEDGQPEDLPADVLTQLQQMGWLAVPKAEQKNQATPPAEDLQTVTHSGYYANIQLQLPEGWEYSLEEYTYESSGMVGIGICFYPPGATGTITAMAVDFWGVCGTGLEEHYVEYDHFGGMMGTYDGQPHWDFISALEQPGSYVFLSRGMDTWTQEQQNHAMAVVQSARFAEGIMTKEEALDLALETRKTGVWECTAAQFDIRFGVWKLTLAALNNTSDDPEVEIHVFPDGAALEVVEPIACEG